MRRTFLIFCLGLFPFILKSQWSCPSHLGSSLKPVGKSKLNWGNEIALGAGYITHNSIFNTMILMGLDYSWENNSIYVEGGFKNWVRNDFNVNLNFHNERFGLREFFYQNKSNFGNFTIGLQSLRSNDSYTINERVMGLNYSKISDRFITNAYTGTVTKDFARNGIFCDVSYMYDILPYQNRTIIGTALGQTNFAGFTFEIIPGKKQVSEFSEFSEFESEKSKSIFKIESIGFTGYSEFGKWINQPHYLAGVFAKATIGNSFTVKPQLFYQPLSSSRALIYQLRVEQNRTWNNSHRTQFEASYLGIYSIDNNAKALSLFTNIFSGVVLRLDAQDMPFYYFFVKHSIPNIRTHLKVNYTSQVKLNPQQELDIEIGKRFSPKLNVNTIAGYIKSPLVDGNNYLLRIELRYNY